MSDFQSISTAFADAVGTVAGSTVAGFGSQALPSASGVVWSSDGVIVTANHVVQRRGHSRGPAQRRGRPRDVGETTRAPIWPCCAA
ncbi:MAG: hypothetical protein R2856_08090 [Caldilineaceae bacterium]